MSRLWSSAVFLGTIENVGLDRQLNGLLKFKFVECMTRDLWTGKVKRRQHKQTGSRQDKTVLSEHSTSIIHISVKRYCVHTTETLPHSQPDGSVST